MLLLVEDDEAQAQLVRETLLALPGAGGVQLAHARTLAEGIRALEERPPDIVLLDLSLPDADGLAGLDRIRARWPSLPIVVRSGHDDDALALDAVRHGAQDYLIKGEHGPALLWRSLRHAVERAGRARSETGMMDERDHALIAAESAMVAQMLRHSGQACGLEPFRAGIQLAARYEVVRHLGSGASSHVYAARDARSGAQVCVKHLRVDATDSAVKELARETRLTAALEHPRIVRILDFGTVWGEPFLVMELAEGGALARLLREGPLPAPRARDVMLDVLEGLVYIHARDTLHLDLKPANIVLDAEGRAKITDFGIALDAAGRRADETQRLLGAPRIYGTPAYVSPEVVAGHPPTPLSDVYSAGAVLYELLAGRPYLDLRGMDLFAMRAAIREQRPTPGAPGGPLLDVALRALEKAPEERYASALDMRRAVEAAAPGAPAGALAHTIDVRTAPAEDAPPRAPHPG